MGSDDLLVNSGLTDEERAENAARLKKLAKQTSDEESDRRLSLSIERVQRGRSSVSNETLGDRLERLSREAQD